MTTKSFPVRQPIHLVVRIGHGTVRVTAIDDLTEATVTLTASTGSSEMLERTTVELQGSRLAILSPRQGGIFDLRHTRSRDAVDVSVTVPSGTPVKVSSFTADVTLTGRCGTTDIAAGTSEITAEFVDGDLRLRTGSSQCHVERVSGSVQARSGSGSVRFGEVGGSLTSSVGNGRLDVGVARGAVRLRTGSGAATIGAIYDDVTIASGGGELRLGLPSGVAAHLDLTTGSGRVDSQLPIEDEAPASGRAITIRARTGSGNVQLFRAAA